MYKHQIDSKLNKSGIFQKIFQYCGSTKNPRFVSFVANLTQFVASVRPVVGPGRLQTSRPDCHNTDIYLL